MNIKISFKNLEHTPALDEKIREKTGRLEKYLGGGTEVHWTCSVHDGHHFFPGGGRGERRLVQGHGVAVVMAMPIDESGINCFSTQVHDRIGVKLEK